jgi:hypothetical protein
MPVTTRPSARVLRQVENRVLQVPEEFRLPPSLASRLFEDVRTTDRILAAAARMLRWDCTMTSRQEKCGVVDGMFGGMERAPWSGCAV